VVKQGLNPGFLIETDTKPIAGSSKLRNKIQALNAKNLFFITKPAHRVLLAHGGRPGFFPGKAIRASTAVWSQGLSRKAVNGRVVEVFEGLFSFIFEVEDKAVPP